MGGWVGIRKLKIVSGMGNEIGWGVEIDCLEEVVG